MTRTERTAWGAIEWCEDHDVPASDRCRFAAWYASRCAGAGFCLPHSAAYMLWVGLGMAR